MIRPRIADSGNQLCWALALLCLPGCGRSELFALGEREPPQDSSAQPDDSGADVAAPGDAADGPAEVGGFDAGQVRDASDAASHADASDASADACPDPSGCSLVFASGPSWSAWSGTLSTSPASFTLGQSLGAAREVCLNAGDPAGCPTGALLYGYASSPLPIWSGGSGIPVAFWIWRPDVTPSSYSEDQVAIFQKGVAVGTGATGSIVISVDDMAMVFVNGALAGTVGSITDINTAAAAHTVATTINLTPVLRAGFNVITVAAENGPFGSAPYTYAQNPAGVVFEGTLKW